MLVQKAIEPVQVDINAPMAKLDMQYDELSHMVHMLWRELTQKNNDTQYDELSCTVQLIHWEFLQVFSQLETILLSLTLQGDGHA